MSKSSSFLLYSVCIGAGIFLFTGCQKAPPAIEKETIEQIKRFKGRLEKLEQRVDQHLPPLTTDGIKTPDGPIKSLTFRVGTKDDRLRIYWEDGSKSDLPCTKEQSIWVCG